MKDKENNNALNCRVDPVFLKFRRDNESNREFVERAIAALRDNEDLKKTIRDLQTVSFTNVSPLEHAILVKLIKVFIDKELVVDTITQDEGRRIEEIMNEEGL